MAGFLLPSLQPRKREQKYTKQEVSDKRSDETVMRTPELVFNGNGNGVRLFAYSSAICGKEGSALGN
jgi:hypothetical protein